MRSVDHFLPCALSRAEHLVHLLHPLEAGFAGGNRKNVVAFAGFEVHWPRRDQPGHVVHLGPIQDARDVVVDAVADAHHAIAEGIQVAGHQPRLDSRLDGLGEQRRHAAAESIPTRSSTPGPCPGMAITGACGALRAVGVSKSPSAPTPGRLWNTNFSRRYPGYSLTSIVCGWSGVRFSGKPPISSTILGRSCFCHASACLRVVARKASRIGAASCSLRVYAMGSKLATSTLFSR